MPPRRKKPRDKGAHDLAKRYRQGEFDASQLDTDELSQGETFSARSKHAQKNKMMKTAELRAGQAADEDAPALPTGQVIQVYSLFCDVLINDQLLLCVVRKTMAKVAETQIVVGDFVRVRISGTNSETGRTEGVVEQILPRKTILTRADSFKQLTQHPIVANADQMLIVASVKFPNVKWGLVDRMLISARSGGLVPMICLNKIDLVPEWSADAEADVDERVDPLAALSHYAAMGVKTLQTSVTTGQGLQELTDSLKEKETVLAGHSGVGKSSLIRAIQPQLDIRVGQVSHFTDKGKHTTTSAKRYDLTMGGHVIDTPGVKLFGLWKIDVDSLDEFYPDMKDGSAPPWRVASYERIAASL